MIHGLAIGRFPVKEYLAYQRGDTDPAVLLSDRYSPILSSLPERAHLGHLVAKDAELEGKGDIRSHHRSFMLKYLLAPRPLVVIQDEGGSGNVLPSWKRSGAPLTIIFEGKPGHPVMQDYPDVTALGNDLFLLRRGRG